MLKCSRSRSKSVVGYYKGKDSFTFRWLADRYVALASSPVPVIRVQQLYCYSQLLVLMETDGGDSYISYMMVLVSTFTL